MTTKTHIVNQFKEAVTRLGEDLPEDRRSTLHEIERAFGELRQLNGTLKRNLDAAETALPAANREALRAKEEALQRSQQAERLAQQLANKEQEVVRLQTALADKTALLVAQRAKGFNAEMLKDFLGQLEMDLRTAIEENEDPKAQDDTYMNKLRYFFERYGQFGGFTPQTVSAMSPYPTATADATERQLQTDLRAQNLKTYRTELDCLLALKDRLAFALECCRRPRDQFVRTFSIGSDGAVERDEKWMDVEIVCKRNRKSVVS